MPRVRCLVALVVVGLLGVLTPAAHADPPDPTWLAGYWDDNDFDTAVGLIAGASALAARAVIVEANPSSVPAERGEATELIVDSLTLQALSSPRAPPERHSSDS